MKRNMRQLAAALFGATIMLGLTACAREGGIYTVYEERYRLFYLKDQFAPEQLNRDPEIAARSFIPMASLNRSFEQLSNEGFTLAKIRPMGDSGGATQFVFRRTIPD